MFSLDKLMQKSNSIYYKKEKPSLYNDFLTYSQRKRNLLAKACAINFYSNFKQSKEKNFDILEVGVGNGNFAFSFLDKLKSLDKNFLKKINYFLADFSKPLLDLAYKNLEKFSLDCQTNKVIFDASNFSKFKVNKKFDYIVGNELLSDLPAKIFVKKDGCIYEVFYNKKLNFKLVKKHLELKKEKNLFSYFPQNFFIPINYTAKNLIFFLYKKLKKNGYIQFFDYGFYTKEDFILDEEDWNRLIVRKYNSQITIDLNFYYLKHNTPKLFFSKILKQKEYVKITFSKDVSLIETKEGLDYSFKKKDFEEEDYFYSILFSKSKSKISFN